MASANQGIMVKKDWVQPVHTDWVLANPWVWLTAGLACTVWSMLWTFARGPNASDYRVIVLAVGLLLAGVGLWMRGRDRKSHYLQAWQAPIALLLAFVFALAFLAVTGVLVASFFVEESLGLKSGPLFLVWVSFGPASFFAARRCLNRNTAALPASQPLHEDPSVVEEEISFAFVFTAIVCVIGSFTLYADPATPTDWDTLRMFLRVCMAVSLAAAVLTVLSTALRRLILSFLFTLHFTGICTAALSAPPSPWIVQQTWMRLFRPYLEFAYLNNAYHFYAPEPGPSSYLWFRVIYEDPATGAEEGRWVKVPDLDDTGRIRHPVALDYQRFLSLTEAVAFPDPLPAESQYNPQTNAWEQAPFYADRLRLVPMNPGDPDEPQPVVVGVVQPKPHIPVRLQPGMPYLNQVKIPNDGSRRLLSSYARFVARKYATPESPAKAHLQFQSVKIYMVVHSIPPVHWFLNEIPPTDPELYRPFYFGKYDAEGKQFANFDAEGKRTLHFDPYLYWLLPVIRDNPSDPDSQIRDYARKHAGDPHWVRRGSDREWVAWKDRDIPQPPQPLPKQ